MSNTKEEFHSFLKEASPGGYTKEDFALLGKRASRLYVEKGVPLNEAVTKIASENSGMTQDHIKRLIEQANISTFETFFKEGNKKAEFDVADPDVILLQTQKTASAQEDVFIDCIDPPTYDLGLFNTKLAEHKETATHSLWSTHSKLASGYDYIVREAESAENLYTRELNKLASLMDREIREGTPIGVIHKLIKVASSKANTQNKVLSDVSEYGAIKHAEYVPDNTREVPNTDHPIYHQYQVTEETRYQADRLKVAAAQLKVERDSVKKVILEKTKCHK
jgi:hypothetical protein